MRSYEVQITVRSPITLRAHDDSTDKETLFRILGNLLTEVSIDAEREVRLRLEQMKEQAAEAGLTMNIPTLDEPMGVSFSVTDVTGHVGKQWQPKV